jgi:bis(5'-nucleosyl)-tetraphosphatase (symmetrical)
MATYAIGDVQGCFQPLQALLKKIHFKPEQDQLWFVGDLVNRGPDSLETLRFIKSLPNSKIVLGNHDIHLLALAYGHPYPHHTLAEILKAPDLAEIIAWLRRLPFLYHDTQLNYVMTHAGIYPLWSIEQAKKYAAEITAVFQQADFPKILLELYGNEPAQWSEDLTGIPRWRFIINAFTRMRFCNKEGKLELQSSEAAHAAPAGYLPWFQLPRKYSEETPIIFGHWAALQGKTEVKNIFALDTGCVWGNCLTAMRLEDQQRFSVPCVSRFT